MMYIHLKEIPHHVSALCFVSSGPAPLEQKYCIHRRIGHVFFHEKGLESWGCGLSTATTKIWEHHTMNITYG